MLSRAVLAYVLALPIFVSLTASASGGYTLALTMAAAAPGFVQVFFDTGKGFSEAQSATTPVYASPEPLEYRLALPYGQYRHIRVDPGTGPGRYDIRGAIILAPNGSTRVVIPAADLTPLHQLATLERTPAKLVVEAPHDGTDPQLLYAPVTPLELAPEQRIPRGTIRRLALAWLVALVAVVIGERLLLRIAPGADRGLRRLWVAATSHPCHAILVVSLIATGVATYPVLFLGRSLVSPNNGGLRLLNDWLPGVPASADLVIEDTRASDVSAALYAFVPYTKVQRDALATREWPLWNRYNATGRPLWGQGQTFFLDPLHWLTLITPDPALGWDLKFVAHRFVFAAGIGLAAFVVTGAWVPGAIAAVAAPFVGVYAYRVNHPAVFSLTYAAWALLGWFLLARARDGVGRTRAAILLGAAAVLILVASPPKEAVAALLATCGAGTLTVLLSSSWRDSLSKLRAAVAAGVTVVLVTAPHWLMFLDTLRLSRTAYDKPYAEIAGLPHAVAFFLGPLTGSPVFPGLHALGLVMVLAVLTAPRWVLATREVLACALVTGALVAVAFGVVPDRWLFRIPFIANIGHLHDVFITAAVPLVLILTAAGAVVLLSAGVRRTALVTVLTLIGAWWLVRRVAELAPRNGFEPWAALFVLILAAMLPGCLSRLRQQRVLPAVAVATTVLVLVLPGGLHGRSGIAPLDALLVQPRLRVSLDANSPAVDSIHYTTTDATRTVGLEWVLVSGSQALYELEGLGGPDALVIAKYEELVDAAGIWRSNWLTRVGTGDVARLSPLLDLLNVEFFLGVPATLPAGFTEVEVSGSDRLRIARRETAWPRAFFVAGTTRYVDASDLLRKVAEHQRPFAAVQLSDDVATHATRELTSPSGDAIPAHGYKLSINSTTFKVRAPGAGVVVLAETYLPDDFRATLNGRAVEYFRVNHVFKGVVVPSAGDWEVGFVYRPRRWILGWTLAWLGLVAAAGFLFVSQMRRPVAPASKTRSEGGSSTA